MVRILRNDPIEQYYGVGAKRYMEIACLSTDEKPTENVATGSILCEVDTGVVFFYDEESGWTEQFSFQGEE